jgi:molecular chaperone DnaK (HSP70)
MRERNGERWRRRVDGRDVDTPFPFMKYEQLLSVDPVVRIDIPEIDIDVELERAGFGAMISGPLETFDQAVQKVLDDAGLGPSDVNVVLRPGGSALIPAFTQILERRFPGKVVQYDPFTGVASGLAVVDDYGIGHRP